MNQTEQRLSELLHQFTPEPPNAISPDAVAARVRDPAAPRRLGWRGWLPAAAAAAVVAIAAISIGLVLASRADHQSPSTIGQGPRPTPSASASTGVAPGQCSTARLKASVIDSGSMASQPFVVVALTNGADKSCWLSGYPGVTAEGTPSTNVSATPSPLAIDVRHGSIYEREDPGPIRVTLRPGASASFALGTGTAYNGGLVNITDIAVSISGDASSIQVNLQGGLLANGPAGQPIPVGITAFTASDASTRTRPSGQIPKPTCQTQSLKLDRAKAEGTAGSTYVTYALTNVGSIACTMYGFPGVSFLDASGTVIQHPAARDGQANAKFDLQPGQRAQFVVRTSDPSIPGTGCSPSWVSTQIQVYPPDQTVALRIPVTDHVCNLTVSATKPSS